jgi:hypothetical protein
MVYPRSQATGRRATFRSACSPRLAGLATVDHCRCWDFPSIVVQPLIIRPKADPTDTLLASHADRLHQGYMPSGEAQKLWSLEWKGFLVRAASGRLVTSKNITASHLGTPHGPATAHVHTDVRDTTVELYDYGVASEEEP